MKEHRQLGTYALIINDENILLIKKANGPYKGKLDLPGGTIEFNERPVDTLKRELLEEVGIEIKDYEIFDVDSVSFEWYFEEKDIMIKEHHIGVFYKVFNYENEIKKEVEVNEVNDDSLGAEFYEIKSLKKDQLSEIVILELNKLGYNI